ncbi:MAG: response regulator [Thermoleophilia bacterium]|nr:response regulator [Thermoleophilia bacterium]
MNRVLVVDDDAVIRMVVRDALEAVGLHVIEAAGPEVALERVRCDAPDLLILDIMLPRMDGLALLSQIRDSGNDITVLVFSATGARNEDRARELGAAAYLAKPFQIDLFVDTVQQLLVDLNEKLSA